MSIRKVLWQYREGLQGASRAWNTSGVRLSMKYIIVGRDAWPRVKSSGMSFLVTLFALSIRAVAG